MRRIIPVLFAGGILLTAASCGTAPNPPAAGGSSASAVPVALATTCQELAKAYEKNMGPLAQSLAAVAAGGEQTTPAQTALADFAHAVQQAAEAGGDPQLRADGKKAADQMLAKSEDPAFFTAIKTPADVDKTIGPTLSGWLSPIARHCS